MMGTIVKRNEFKEYLRQMKGEISEQLSVLKFSAHTSIIVPL